MNDRQGRWHSCTHFVNYVRVVAANKATEPPDVEELRDIWSSGRVEEWFRSWLPSIGATMSSGIWQAPAWLKPEFFKFVPPDTPGVYVLWREDCEYVGMSSDLRNRVLVSVTERRLHLARMQLHFTANAGEAAILEQRLIYSLLPAQNQRYDCHVPFDYPRPDVDMYLVNDDVFSAASLLEDHGLSSGLLFGERADLVDGDNQHGY